MNDSGGAAASATLINCTITNNTAGYGGGATESCGLSNCFIAGNFSFYGGGATDSTLTNCTLTANSGNLGGGALNSTLIGCTLTNNSTYDSEVAGAGGGAANSAMDACLISGNMSSLGGGANGGTLTNCALTGNFASSMGGGANGSTLNNCTLSGNQVGALIFAVSNGSKRPGPTPLVFTSYFGGGAENCTLNNCALMDNQANNGGFGDGDGGGADSSTLNNCAVTDNIADFAGGVENSILNNCTVTGNSGRNNYGGAANSTLNNCIVYYNNNSDYFNSTLVYCCTPQPPDNSTGNITNAPGLVDLAGGDLRLQSNSPCINSGDNAYAPSGLDLYGNARIAGGTVDMGAYEFQTPTSLLSYAWAQQYGLPTDGSADFLDLDGDGMNNLQESIAGTNPTNVASVLRMQKLSPATTNNPPGLLVTWQSVSNRIYYLQRGGDPRAGAGFAIIQSNLVGQAGTTSYTDATATNSGPYFYRVGVQ